MTIYQHALIFFDRTGLAFQRIVQFHKYRIYAIHKALLLKQFYLACGMFERLRKKWNLAAPQVLLVLLTFALGGTLTGMTGKRLMSFIPAEGLAWAVIYIIIMTLIWPLMVLLVSIPLGQFSFFRNYLRRIGSRIAGKSEARKPGPAPDSTPMTPVQLALFASGSGTNAQKIMERFQNHPHIRVALVVASKSTAGVLERAETFGVPSLVLDRERFLRGDSYIPFLKEKGIDFIVLAGFLWKVPAALVAAWPHRMINIHPALLPKYGGKGMYGRFVHEAVIAAGDRESGITIHYVDDHYDHGATIFQAACPVTPNDTPDSLAEKIHQLEHTHFPRVVEETVMEQLVKKA